MSYFKCFSWKELIGLLIALLPSAYYFSISRCDEKNSLALFCLMLFLWITIPLVKRVRELESEIECAGKES
ncbi:MAG: hypothetical protein JKY01_00460 [Pseudomonadales bacterium]|nr:hypothetical protein [Pseudomonadales bacterium]